MPKIVILAALGVRDLEELAGAVVPPDLPLLPAPAHAELGRETGGLPESAAVEALRGLAALNDPHTEMIGCGYHPALTPAVIARDVLGEVLMKRWMKRRNAHCPACCKARS